MPAFVQNDFAAIKSVKVLPICLYRSKCVSGNSTASRISCFCMSKPPTSPYVTSGFSWAPSIAIEESASGGSISTSEFEWRWSATEDDGLSFSLSSVERMRTT